MENRVHSVSWKENAEDNYRAADSKFEHLKTETSSTSTALQSELEHDLTQLSDDSSVCSNSKLHTSEMSLTPSEKQYLVVEAVREVVPLSDSRPISPPCNSAAESVIYPDESPDTSSGTSSDNLLDMHDEEENLDWEAVMALCRSGSCLNLKDEDLSPENTDYQLPKDELELQRVGVVEKNCKRLKARDIVGSPRQFFTAEQLAYFRNRLMMKKTFNCEFSEITTSSCSTEQKAIESRSKTATDGPNAQIQHVPEESRSNIDVSINDRGETKSSTVVTEEQAASLEIVTYRIDIEFHRQATTNQRHMETPVSDAMIPLENVGQVRIVLNQQPQEVCKDGIQVWSSDRKQP